MSVYIETGFNGDEYDLTHPRTAHLRRGTSGGVVASSEASGFAATNAFDRRLDTAWRPASATGDWYVTFASARTVEYVGIAGHDLGTQNATIRIQYTTDTGSNWTDFTGLDAIEPSDDSTIFCLVDPIQADGYRVVIDAADAAPTIATIAGGSVTEWPQRAVWTGQPITESDQITFANNSSDTGVLVGRTVESDGLQFSVQVDNLSETFRRVRFNTFKQYANGEDAVFFIATRPGDYPDEVAYAWATDVVRMTRERPNSTNSGSVTLNLRGYRQDL